MSDSASSLGGPDLAAGVPMESLREGVPLLGFVEREPVILVRRNVDVFAVGATCTHYGGPLGEGLVVDDTVRCPWHHACFDLRTGAALRAPALNPVASYDVVQRQGSVFVGPRKKAPVRSSASRGDAPSAIVIVGAGAAGNSAAQTLRDLGFGGEITLIDADESAPYDRPNLSKDYLAGTAPDEWLPLHPRAYYDELGVKLALGRRVTGLDSKARSLTFDDGTTRRFAAAILATGAEPVNLTIPGENGPPVYYLRTLADCQRIIQATKAARRAVVLGASFIGLEVAASLRHRGIDVHVVAPGARPLQRVLGPRLGDFIQKLHEDHGVVFHLGQTARGLERGYVVLQNGERLGADFVVAGVGVRPNETLAKQAGLAVDRGIVVDAYLETSAKGVFAIGDVARWPDPRGGGNVRIEHWVVAQRQGQAVARTLVAERAPFKDVPFFWSQHYDLAINYVGHAAEWDDIELDGSLEKRDCTIRYRRGDRVLAVATISRDRASMEAELAMEREIATT